ncbi:Atu4866 domain-containing protein [Streptomyces griseoincarnatus]
MPVSQAACPAAFKSQAGCVTRTGFLRQELTADGRCDETRGGRTHAYRDASGSTATASTTWTTSVSGRTGGFEGDELHHAGHVMRRG